MKIKVHVPTEQYGFVEAEFDADKAIMEADAASSIYEKLKAEFNRPINELPLKDMDTFVEHMLLGEPNHVETYNKMSPQQQHFIQIIKRAIKRINYKLQKDKEN